MDKKERVAGGSVHISTTITSHIDYTTVQVRSSCDNYLICHDVYIYVDRTELVTQPCVATTAGYGTVEERLSGVVGSTLTGASTCFFIEEQSANKDIVFLFILYRGL